VSKNVDEFESRNSGTWTTDPLSKKYKLYQLRFVQYTNKVKVFDSWNDFKSDASSSTITLPIAAADAKMVVWDNNIYYLSSGKKLIKYSIQNGKQVRFLLKSLVDLSITEFKIGPSAPDISSIRTDQ